MILQHTDNPVYQALSSLFVALPLNDAMASLVVTGATQTKSTLALVEKLIAAPLLAPHPALHAALWLYVDELDRSHRVSQNIDTSTGSYWHGIMHRREGDFSNSHYWFRHAGRHPAIPRVGEGYDPHRLIDDAEQAYRRGQTPENLLALQRREWATLFQWCVDND